MAFSDYLDEPKNEWQTTSVNWEGLDDANAKAAKRMRAAELRKQIENLKAQRAEVVARRDAKIAERKALRDEDIVAMGKVKGISDSDLQQYINGRVTQRNADISNAQTAAQKGVEEATKAQTNSEAATKTTEALESLVKQISDLNYVIGTGTVEAREKAKNEKRALEPSFERRKLEYKNLTGKEWTENPVDYSKGADGVDDNKRKELVQRIAVAKQNPNFSQSDAVELQADIFNLYSENMLPEADYNKFFAEVGEIIPNREKKALDEAEAAKGRARSDLHEAQSQGDRKENKEKQAKEEAEKAEKKRKNEEAADKWDESFKDADKQTIDNIMATLKKKNEAVYNVLKDRGY